MHLDRWKLPNLLTALAVGTLPVLAFAAAATALEPRKPAVADQSASPSAGVVATPEHLTTIEGKALYRITLADGVECLALTGLQSAGLDCRWPEVGTRQPH